MINGSSYTFTLVKKGAGNQQIRTKYQITARSQDIAVARIVVYRNQNHEGYAIGFPLEALQGSKVLTLLRSNPVGEQLTEYYRFLKANESDIMTSMKTIRQI